MINTVIKELNIDQLDMVNGGTIGEVADDSKLLHRLGLMDEEYNSFEVIGDWETCSAKVDEAWAKIGVRCISKWGKDNKYSYNFIPLTCDEAQKLAKALMIKGPKTA
ncbi:MAG: hypothetical protein IJL19_06015 [Clostridiales bacterium]|nr:hypothetical protein [Clostridiales bacterium]